MPGTPYTYLQVCLRDFLSPPLTLHTILIHQERRILQVSDVKCDAWAEKKKFNFRNYWNIARGEGRKLLDSQEHTGIFLLII
jgi:hypothetical protein